MPTLGEIRKQNGVAGAVSYTVPVSYAEGETPGMVQFVSSTYGGPVVMVTAGHPDGIFVSDPSRFGEFGPDWVRKFFA